MEDLFLLISKTYGVAGLIILAPFFLLWVVWRDNIALRKELSASGKEVVEAQKQRVKDAQDITLRVIDIVREQAALNTETNLVLERVGDALNTRTLPPSS